MYITKTAVLKVDEETLQNTNTRHAVARLTSNMFVNTEEISANLHIRSIKILFDEPWLKNIWVYLPILMCYKNIYC